MIGDGQGIFDGRLFARFQHPQGRLAQSWNDNLQRMDEMRPKARRRAVRAVQRQPPKPDLAALLLVMNPRRQQRRLAETGRRGEQKQFARQSRCTLIKQAGTLRVTFA